MDLSSVLAFVVMASLLVISPGPNGFLIAKTVPTSGYKAGLSNIAGFVAAFYLHGTLSIFGISILLVQSSNAFFILKLLGAIYLIWIGLKALRSAWLVNGKTDSTSSSGSLKKTSIKGAFIEGFFTNCLNPKVSLFYLAAFPQFISLNNSVHSAYTLVSLHAVINVLWFSVMVFMLSKVKAAISRSRVKVWLNSVTGIALIGFGAKLALSKNN